MKYLLKSNELKNSTLHITFIQSHTCINTCLIRTKTEEEAKTNSFPKKKNLMKIKFMIVYGTGDRKKSKNKNKKTAHGMLTSLQIQAGKKQ